MSTIVTRAGKGSALTHNEVDANFTNLNTDKLQSGNTAAALTITSATINGGAINSTTVGATTPAAGTFTSLSDSGNLTFTGTGNRITGDFSNATVANRVMFQSSTVNGNTVVGAIPNGTGVTSVFRSFNNSDPTNAGQATLGINNSNAFFDSGITGTGTYLPMTFSTGGSERMRVDTSGNVGIGTSSPSGRLHVESSSGGLPLYVNSTASAQNARIRLNSTDNASSVSYVMSYSHASLNKQAAMLLGGTGSVGFYVGQTAGAEPTTGTLAQTIDSSGNVGIGTSSPGAKLDVRGSSTFLVNATNPTAWISVDSALTTGSMYNQWNTTSNVGISGTYTNHAYTFVTNNTERARIDSSGNFLVGKTSASATLDVKTTASQQVGRFSLDATSSQATPAIVIAKKDNTTTTSQVFVQFLINSEGTGSGQINANGASAVAFGSYSDERLKENIVDLPPQLENILALRPVEFDYKTGGHQIGFIAQEMQEVYPDVIGNGSDEMLTITGWSKTEARLVKAIQEQQQMIETLQAEVAALKGA
jgi:hypothetical protein